MAIPTRTEARGLNDILSTESYRMELGQIPGAEIDAQIAVQCTAATYPGVTNEIFTVSFPGGHELSYRGRKIFPKTLSLTYVETTDMNITRSMGQWFEFICGTDSGSSSDYKIGYTIDGSQLFTYDTTGQEADVVTFYGLQISDKPDVSYDPGSSTAYTIQITLTYDFYTSKQYGVSGLAATSTVGG